ncbi:MAG: 2TM domain-containing protein [Aigarchaeota archaeon]|nr:2TM domain-containing protein [Aigarchaeota archaeon]MCX8192760.1 2TM domain-containing protein [Nitrososphaeria archaeon]MDW7986007.1 2TM domain-containing protein [Nitrososphaerota archaeon]
MSKDISLEEFKEAWKNFEIREARKDFINHFIAYIIVNVFIIFVNLWISPREIWFVWPLVGWGIGLSFHYVFSRPSHVIDNVEKKAAIIESLVKRELRKRE